MRWIPWLAVVLVLAGCSAPPPPRWAEPRCPLVGAREVYVHPRSVQRAGGIPDGFAASWVLRCRIEPRTEDGANSTVLVVERADADLTDLVDALRMPDKYAWPFESFGCAASVATIDYFVLVDADGRALRPEVPLSKCESTRGEVNAALRVLPFRTLAEMTLQVNLKFEDPKCPDTFEDPFEGGGARPGPPVALEGDRVRVCRYSMRKPGPPRPAGGYDFTMTGNAARELLDVLGAARPAPPCTLKHTAFAVIEINGPVPHVVAELDGCRRLMRANNTLGQLDEPEIVTLSR